MNRLHQIPIYDISFIAQACETQGPVDILINCAGFAVCGLFEETSVEDFKVRCSLKLIDNVIINSLMYNILPSVKK